MMIFSRSLFCDTQLPVSWLGNHICMVVAAMAVVKGYNRKLAALSDVVDHLVATVDEQLEDLFNFDYTHGIYFRWTYETRKEEVIIYDESLDGKVFGQNIICKHNPKIGDDCSVCGFLQVFKKVFGSLI
uniref:Uncharacterized protein n=1 Tax=Tanacetum cinerariifolium TaxID=118510 RepID=A0A6L2JEB1_TANCI|nr:hypothetical protein [Tanacetum cinerariifolium]